MYFLNLHLYIMYYVYNMEDNALHKIFFWSTRTLYIKHIRLGEYAIEPQVFVFLVTYSCYSI